MLLRNNLRLSRKFFASVKKMSVIFFAVTILLSGGCGHYA